MCARSREELLDQELGPDGQPLRRIEAQYEVQHRGSGRQSEMSREKLDVAGVLFRASRCTLHGEECRRIGNGNVEVAERAPRLDAGVGRDESLRGVVEPVLR